MAAKSTVSRAGASTAAQTRGVAPLAKPDLKKPAAGASEGGMKKYGSRSFGDTAKVIVQVKKLMQMNKLTKAKDMIEKLLKD